MILVHRLKGEPIFINADMIQSIEARPDTVVVLIDGRTFVLADEPSDIVDRVRRFRASVLVAADEIRDTAGTVSLTVVADREQ